MDLSFLKGKYGLQFILLLFILLTSTIIFGLLSLSFLAYNEGTTMEVISSQVENGDANISLTSRYALIIFNQLGTFLLPALVFAGLFKTTRKAYLKFHFSVENKFWVLIAPLMIACVFIVGYLAHLNELFPISDAAIELEEEAMVVYDQLMGNDSVLLIVLNIIIIGLLPAIAEEFIFRGIIQKLFISWAKKPWLGILITAFIFSFIHFQFLTFLPRFFMGIVLGYLFLWSRSLVIPILAHFVYNSINIIGYHFLENSNSKTQVNYFILSLSVLLFIGIFYRLKPKTIPHE